MAVEELVKFMVSFTWQCLAVNRAKSAGHNVFSDVDWFSKIEGLLPACSQAGRELDWRWIQA